MKTNFRKISQLIFIAIFFVWHRNPEIAIAQENETEDKIHVRISYKTKAQEIKVKRLLLEKLGQPIENEMPNEYVETRLTWGQIIQLRLQDYDIALVFTLNLTEVSPAYHNYAEVVYAVDSLAEKYPALIHITQIGKSARHATPIIAVKISDNPTDEEDEPAVLFTGVHHAREPLGAEICLYLLKYFCGNYTKNPAVKYWLDETEIWIVPVLNPDGLELALDPLQNLNWWRKNCRDNNQNGRFDSDSDGVDLNRNYDFNWRQGGASDLTSLYYRGLAPFSEPETQAIRQLAFQQNFVFAIDYHSFGEAILYPWGNFQRPPEYKLILKIAEKMAACIKKVSNHATYDLIPLDAQMGQSSVWYYAELNTLGYIVETGDSYYPSEGKINTICSENLRGVKYLLNRLHAAGLYGHIRDAQTKEPLIAEIRINGLTRIYTKPRQSEPNRGRYDKILSPGTYSVTFSALGYISKTVHNIVINEDKPTLLDVELFEDKNCGLPGNN